jgi:hypothetical protein
MTFLNIAAAVWLVPAAVKLTAKALNETRKLKRRKYTNLYYTPDDKDLCANMRQDSVY